MLDLTRHKPITLMLNCRKFCDSWDCIQFFPTRIRNMFAHRLHVATEQRRHCWRVSHTVSLSVRTASWTEPSEDSWN
ncbi:hypothetical protein [Bifidobacterium mongoliense]|uniref:hypothetical protein n=1 Tax=Bifidobacterium mongoliense TaxID=518643 RepID=UPI0026485D27|nr:hypothetical protein [Bifidobacterium mongoliense]